VGGAYRVHGGEEKCVQNFRSKNCREEATWKTGVDGEIVKLDLTEISLESLDWTYLAQYRGQ
jgi:hypothetical protein